MTDNKNLKQLDGPGLMELAQKSVTENNLEGTLAVFDEIVRRTDSKLPSPLFSRATCYIQLKRYKEAVEDCKLILKLPDGPIEEGLVQGSTSLHSAAYSRLNNAYKNLNMVEEASEALQLRSQLEQEAQKKNPPKPSPTTPSTSTTTTTKPKSASEIIGKTETPSTRLPPELESKVKGLKDRANKLYQEDKYEEAVKIYDLALQFHNDNAPVHSNLSQTYLKLDKLEEALRHADEAVRVEPTWAKGYYRQGMAYMKLKKFTEATAALQTALEYAPEDQLITSSLAQCLSQSHTTSPLLSDTVTTTLSVLIALLCVLYVTGLLDSLPTSLRLS